MNKIKFLIFYLKTSLKSIIFSFFCSIIFVGCTLLIPLFCGKCVDTISNAFKFGVVETNFYYNEVKYLVIIAALVSFVVLFQFLYEVLLNITCEEMVYQIRCDLFKKLDNVQVKYIDKHMHGDLVSRCVNDVENISTGFLSGFKQLYQGIITILFTIGFMFYQNWLLGLIILILTPLSFLISYTVAKKSNKYFKKQSILVGSINSLALENFENIDIVKSFNYSEKSFEKFNDINSQLNSAGQKAQFSSSFTNPSTRLINNSIYAVVGICGALLVAFGSTINIGATLTVGGVTAFLQYANQFAKPLNEISSCIPEIQTCFQSINRILEVLNEKNEIDDGKIIFNDNFDKLELHNIAFGYDDSKLIYKNLSLNISNNQKIALVGPTGCGKTTVINLILRFYDPQKGQILLNKVNINDFTKESYRNIFGMVLQESWIFKGSVFQNIAYDKKDATLEEVIEVAKKARCYDFIMKLSDGFDTVIDNDSSISEGQKQLISIARVMLSNKKILILDEATSNVDTRTEKKIGEALDELMKNKTSIVIAHRLSTIMSSDQIFVIKDGEIIESGTHKQLLDKKGFYFDLFTSQYK